MKNTRPNSTAKTHRQAALPAAYARERNSRSGTIGWAARSSQPMKAAVSAAPAVSAATISGLAQPMPLARISPQTRPRAPPVASTRPSGSRLAAARAVGRELGQDQRDQDQADRDVQPEDPRPGDALRDRAADDRAGRHRQPGHAR